MKSAARLLALAALTALAPAALAGDNYYTNASGNFDWLTAANWSLGHVPNTTDDVHIPAGMTVFLRGGQGHYAGNINNFGSLIAFDHAQPTVLNCKQIINFNSGVWNTSGVLISHTNIFNVGYMYFNACSVWDSNYTDANPVYIVNYAGAFIDLVDSGVVGQVQNQGTLSLWGFNTLGAALTATPGGGIENQSGGVVNMNPNAIVDSGNANLQVFSNTGGTVNFVGGGNSFVYGNVWFYNAALCKTINSNAFIGNCASLDPSGVLFTGQWTAAGGSFILDDGAPVTRIDSGVVVDLAGGSMNFNGLTSISGILRASNGSTAHAIPSGGILNVDGSIELENNGAMLVSGALDTTNANLLFHVEGPSASPSNYGQLVVTNYVLGHATTWLNVYNDNGYIPQPGENYKLITAYAGQGYDNLIPYRWNFPNDDKLTWLFDGPSFTLRWACRADINGDGFINGDDYDMFASFFESGSLQADINNDGFVNGDDYDMFASAFEAGC